MTFLIILYCIEKKFALCALCAHCACSVCFIIVCSLCVFIVRFRCACCALCVKLLCARRAHSLCAAVVHNVNPDLLRNEAAQCKTVVRSAWHNGLARVSGAIPAWHNGFGIVRICLMELCVKYNTVYMCTRLWGFLTSDSV